MRILEYKIKDYSYKLPISDSYEIYNEITKKFMKYAYASCEILSEKYDDCKTIEKVLETLPVYIQNRVDSMCDEAVGILYSYDIKDISKHDFIKKFFQDYFNYNKEIDYVFDRYSEIIDAKKQLKEYRELEKASRSKWVGGGFGVGGAVKGAVTAGAMNAGTNFLRSFGDAGRASADINRIDKLKTALYKDKKTKNSFINGLCDSMVGCSCALTAELEVNEIIFDLPIDVNKASSLFENTIKHEKDEKTIFDNIMNCIYMNPHNLDFYKFLIDIHPADEKLISMIDYFGMSEICETYRKKVLNGMIEERAGELTKNFEFSNPSKENVNKAQEILNNIKEEYGYVPAGTFTINRIENLIEEKNHIEEKINEYNSKEYIVNHKKKIKEAKNAVLVTVIITVICLIFKWKIALCISLFFLISAIAMFFSSKKEIKKDLKSMEYFKDHYNETKEKDNV